MNDHVGRPSIRLQTGVTQRNSEFPGRHDLSPELIVRNIYGYIEKFLKIKVKIMEDIILSETYTTGSLSVVEDLDIDIVS